MTNTLQKILRLRHLELEGAKRHLALAIGCAEMADTKLETARTTLSNETSAAALLITTNVYEATAAWLPIAQQDIGLASEAAQREHAAVAVVRDQLAQRRAELRIAEIIAQSKADGERRKKSRNLQHQLEDAKRPNASSSTSR